MKILFLLLFFLFSSNAFALEFKLLNDQVLPNDYLFQNTKVGGLSALYFDSSKNSLIALSDDRGERNSPRFYQFKVFVENEKLRVEPQSVVFLKDDNNETYRRGQLDLEGIVFLPWGNLLLSSEGDNRPKPRIPPRLMEFSAAGRWIRDFLIPEKFMPEKDGKQKKGIRNNLAFEGVTLVPKGDRVIAATEESLIQDGPESNFQQGALARFLEFEIRDKSLFAKREWCYRLEPVTSAEKVEKNFGNGISEILAINDKEILVLERGGVMTLSGFKISLRLFLVKLDSGEDVSSVFSLENKKAKPLKKELVLDLSAIRDQLKNSSIWDNMEGMTWGPRLADGSRTLIMVSDNNFSFIQKTLFAYFKVIDSKKNSKESKSVKRK